MSLPNHPIYLDNHATTPVDPRVIQAMRPFWEAQFANPASAEHVMGRAVAEAVEVAHVGRASKLSNRGACS
jgi:cysteine desulfurase